MATILLDDSNETARRHFDQLRPHTQIETPTYYENATPSVYSMFSEMPQEAEATHAGVPLTVQPRSSTRSIRGQLPRHFEEFVVSRNLLILLDL